MVVQEVPEPVKVLIANIFADNSGYSSQEVIIVAGDRRRTDAVLQLLKQYPVTEINVNNHAEFKQLMTRTHWKDRISILLHLPRRLDFRSSGYYDIAQMLSMYRILGIARVIVVGTGWDSTQEAPKAVRDFGQVLIELPSWGYSIKVNE